MSDIRSIRLNVNGVYHEFLAESRTHLADALRKHLGLTGTHLGCEHGVCGACTILADGQPVRACLILAVQAQEMRIVTIEGLAATDKTHPVQDAMAACGGLQCGFCTPGVVASLVALLEEDPVRSREDIREAVSGHLCRCTGYQGMVDAGVKAAAMMQADR